MIAIYCEASVAASIIFLFFLCFGAALREMHSSAHTRIKEAFHKRPHYEAVILQFARPERRGGRHG